MIEKKKKKKKFGFNNFWTKPSKITRVIVLLQKCILISVMYYLAEGSLHLVR